MNFYFVATEPGEEAFFREALSEYELCFVSELSEVGVNAEIISVFVHCCVDAAFLESHPCVRMITTRSSAVDHIDLEACRSRGVAVGHVPVYGETTVAEHTFALILALSRRLREAMELPSHGTFSYAGARGFDLAGKTLGIVGLGHIGQRVAKFGHCFGMRILGYDLMEMSPDFAATHQIEWTSLENLLREAHVVTLHLLLSPLSRHILNSKTLALCRPGVLIVNTARGGLIDTMALMEALDSGHLGGVGLDVLEDERVLRKGATDIISAEIVKHLQEDAPPDRDQAHLQRRARDLQELMISHSLLAKPNVVFTPHVAFNSVEAVERLNTVTVENIRAFLAGQLRNMP